MNNRQTFNAHRYFVIQYISLLLLFLAAGRYCHAQSLTERPLRNKTDIYFSSTNSVRFIDPDRIETTNSIEFGHSFEIKWHDNGTTKTCGPFEDWPTASNPVLYMTPHVFSIAYKDASHIWIISRLGLRLNGCILMDLNDSSLEKHFKGQYFTLSPDKQHVAYSHPISSESGDLLFIDDKMIYPIIRPGYISNDYKGPKTSDNEYAIQMASTKEIQQLDRPPDWVDSHELQAYYRPSVFYEKKGLGPSANPQNSVRNLHYTIPPDSETSISLTSDLLSSDTVDLILDKN